MVDVEESTGLLSATANHNAYGITKAEEGEGNSNNDTDQQHKKESIGKSSIGLIGSLAIAVNALAGPAILQLPFQYQQSGILPTSVCLIVVALLSAIVCRHMSQTVAKVPGNANYNQCVEFSDVFRVFGSERAYQLTQILFFLTTAVLNMAAIVDTAETVDSTLGFHLQTIGWSSNDGWISWSHDGKCTRRQVKSHECDPFGGKHADHGILLSAGYLLTTIVFLPICLADLKENTSWQIFGFILLVSISLFFCWELSEYPLRMEHGLSWWGQQWSDMMGVILFNFALVLAIPSWLHEKKPSVSVEKTIAWSTALATLLYIMVGVIGALAIPKVNANMLEPMLSGAFGSAVQVASSVFAFFIIGLDIPLFSVLTRYNLTHSGLCSTRVANILVVWIPWSISWLLYSGNAVAVLLDWGGVLLTSIVAFLLPLYIAKRALHDDDQCWLNVWLVLAGLAITVAIVGQIVSTQEYYQLSENYLNSKTVEELQTEKSAARHGEEKF